MKPKLGRKVYCVYGELRVVKVSRTWYELEEV